MNIFLLYTAEYIKCFEITKAKQNYFSQYWHIHIYIFVLLKYLLVTKWDFDTLINFLTLKLLSILYRLFNSLKIWKILAFWGLNKW